MDVTLTRGTVPPPLEVNLDALRKSSRTPRSRASCSISVATVKAHIAHLLSKLDARDWVHLVILAPTPRSSAAADSAGDGQHSGALGVPEVSQLPRPRAATAENIHVRNEPEQR